MQETTSLKCNISSPSICQRPIIEITENATEYRIKKKLEEIILKGAPLEASTVSERPRTQRMTIKMGLSKAKIIVDKILGQIRTRIPVIIM